MLMMMMLLTMMMMMLMIDDDDDVSLDFFNSNVNKIHISRAGSSLFSPISIVTYSMVRTYN